MFDHREVRVGVAAAFFEVRTGLLEPRPKPVLEVELLVTSTDGLNEFARVYGMYALPEDLEAGRVRRSSLPAAERI